MLVKVAIVAKLAKDCNILTLYIVLLCIWIGNASLSFENLWLSIISHIMLLVSLREIWLCDVDL